MGRNRIAHIMKLNSKTNNSTTRRNFLKTASIVGVGGLLAGCTSKADAKQKRTTSKQPREYFYREDGFIVWEGLHLKPRKKKFMGPTMVGTAENISEVPFNRVKLVFEYFSNGNRLGFGKAKTTNLQPNAEWNFKARPPIKSGNPASPHFYPFTKEEISKFTLTVFLD